MATFRIADLQVDTIIGVYEWERDLPQRLAVSIELETDVRKAAASDDLDDTVDYDALSRHIREWAEKQEFQLIETVAIEIMKQVMIDDRVQHARVSVIKPGALKDARYVEVQVDSKDDLC